MLSATHAKIEVEVKKRTFAFLKDNDRKLTLLCCEKVYDVRFHHCSCPVLARNLNAARKSQPAVELAVVPCSTEESEMTGNKLALVVLRLPDAPACSVGIPSRR
jgi:hypothetical protein